MDEISQELYGKAVTWTMVRGTRTSFVTKELQPDMKIWHHFVCARLVPTTRLTEATRDRSLLVYGIKKGLTINVGRWISCNIQHAAQNVSKGIPHPTLITELIASVALVPSVRRFSSWRTPWTDEPSKRSWRPKAEAMEVQAHLEVAVVVLVQAPHSWPDRPRQGPQSST